jgi:hypothetical protein
MKKLVLILSLAFAAGNAQATDINNIFTSIGSAAVQDVHTYGIFNWAVGDMASYKLSGAGGFLNGTMVMSVKSLTASDVVLGQDLDLGFLGKQSCEVTMDVNTGEQKGMVCNGQTQQPPSQDDLELIDSKEDTVTVPAGTFICVYIRAKTQGQEVQQWINPKEVPVMGLVKSIVPSQIGTMTLELTSFKKM